MKNNSDKVNDELEWLHHVRHNELKIIHKILYSYKNPKILEIGGGDGFQAKEIHDSGYSIVSIDTDPRFPQFYPVEKTNGVKLNYPNETFDIVFTSHVLPHIHNIELIFDEIKRVVKKDGIIFHIVPSNGWSFITNFWHYLFIPKYILKSIKKRICGKSQNYTEQNIEIKKTPSSNIKKLFLHPLGENTSFIHELIYFSYRNWKKLFLINGFKIVDGGKGPYITSGYGVFKFKLISFRKYFAKYLFSSSYYFELKL